LSYLLYLQSDIKRSISNGEERFNQLSLEERGKFDEETLVNVNNLRRRMMAAPKADRFNNEYIVVRKCFHINHTSGNKLCGFFVCRCLYIRQLEVAVKASF
jgi:uncharacterized membrane protein